MNIQIRVKQLGKRKWIITPTILHIPELTTGVTLQKFLELVITQQAGAFNAKIDSPQIVNFLLPEELEKKASTGKVGFQENYNQQKANITGAVELALTAFKDGLYKVYLDDTELEQLEEVVEFSEQSTFTFIRLTFLSGGYY